MSGFMPVASSEKSVLFTWWNAGGREVFRPRRRARPTSLPDLEAGRPWGPLLVARAQRGLLDLHQELDVVAGLLQLVEQQFQRLLGLQCGEHPAQLDHDRELVGVHQDLFLAGTRRIHVDGREDPLVRQAAVELDLRVTRALELLEDDRVHRGARLDQRRGDDRERAAVLDVAGRAEEALGRVQRRGVDTTGEDAPAGGGGQVVGTAQAGDRVQQDDDVVAHLDQALGPLDGQLGDGRVVRRRPVEGRGDELALHRALHVGDLLGPLVDEDDHEVALGVVRGDRVGDRLQHHRLAGLRRADDQRTLALADRHDQVDDPRGQLVRLGLQAQALLGVQRGQLVELGALARLLRVQAVDRVQPHERVVLVLALALARLPDGAGDRVATAQAVAADLGQRDVDVVRPGQVARGADERVVVQHVEDAGDRQEDVVLGDGRLALLEALAPGAAAAVAVAVAAPAAAAAALEVVVVLVPVGAVAAVPAAVPVGIAVGVAVGIPVVRPAAAVVALGAAVAVPVVVAVARAVVAVTGALPAFTVGPAVGAAVRAALAAAVRAALGAVLAVTAVAVALTVAVAGAAVAAVGALLGGGGGLGGRG